MQPNIFYINIIYLECPDTPPPPVAPVTQLMCKQERLKPTFSKRRGAYELIFIVEIINYK